MQKQREAALDAQYVNTAKANFKYIENQVSAHEIEAVRIEISMLEEKLKYYEDLLDQTIFKMPINGKLITMNLKRLKNSFMEKGDLFAEAEDSSEVRVEISVPEGDIGEISKGSRVSLKIKDFPYSSFYAKVDKIYPTINEDSTGRYIICECILYNNERKLRTGMTGFGKIEGRKMFAAAAFSRSLVRFFRIEVWSWIP